MEKEIMLTVKMLAYNHERYIAKAIESILSQETEYTYELLIGEDCSTDKTREIVRSYQEQYPDIIRVVYQEYNKGCTQNSYSLDINSKGKYIAGCEGDDYWCDNKRIQKDVDFLEQHPEYVGVSHRCKIVDDDGNEIPENEIPSRLKFWEFDKEIFTLKDYEKWLTPGHGSTQTRRNVIKENNLDYSIVYKASKRVGDRSHLLIHIVEGDIYCMKDVVSCYRYRVASDQNNFMTIQRKNNLRDEDFLMMTRLEDWAWDNKRIKLDLSEVKKDRLVGSVVCFMHDRTKKNLKVILSIIGYSRHPVKYTLYTIKVLFIKLYYWKVLKTDKIIKL